MRLDPARRLLMLVSALCTPLMGCGGDAGHARAATGAGPSLVPLDSVLLAEADTLYLGNPFSLAIDPFDGSFYVSDFFADRVFRFGRDGSLVRTYGRPGEGPGEFRSPTLAFVKDAGTVAAADNNHKFFHLFDRTTGHYLRSMPYEGRLGNSPPVAMSGTWWMPAVNRARETVALRWDAVTDSLGYVGPIPDDYIASYRGIGRFASFYSMGTLAAWADTLLLGMQGRNDLLVVDAAGAVIDTLHVPSARRRGVPAGLQRQFDENRRLSARDLFRAASALHHVHRLPDGSMVLVHHDPDLEGELPGGLITARAFVSVVSADRRRACVDAELPVSPDARPIHGFRGDTLFTLDRRIDGERLQTWIVPHRLDASRCAWTPMR